MQPKILKFITLKDYLNEKYTKDNINIISDFYPQYYEDSKNNTEMVGWSSKHDQYKRFEILLNIGFKKGRFNFRFWLWIRRFIQIFKT